MNIIIEQNSVRKIRANSRNIESDSIERIRIATDWNKSRWTEQSKWRSKKQIAEWVLIRAFKSVHKECWAKRRITMIVAWRWKLKLHLMNRLRARRTNTLKIECKLRRTRNANRWMKWFTREIQESCNSILTWRFTDSSSRESLLNQRMSDSMYHNRRNELMKQMSLMKEYLKCVKQWPLR